MIELMLELRIDEWYLRYSLNTESKTIDYNNKYIPMAKQALLITIKYLHEKSERLSIIVRGWFKG